MRWVAVLLLLTGLWGASLYSAPLTLEQIVQGIDSKTLYRGSEVQSLVLEMGKMYEQEIRLTAEEAVRVVVTPLVGQLNLARTTAWVCAGLFVLTAGALTWQLMMAFMR